MLTERAPRRRRRPAAHAPQPPPPPSSLLTPAGPSASAADAPRAAHWYSPRRHPRFQQRSVRCDIPVNLYTKCYAVTALCIHALDIYSPTGPPPRVGVASLNAQAQQVPPPAWGGRHGPPHMGGRLKKSPLSALHPTTRTNKKLCAPPREGGAPRPPHRGGRHMQHTLRPNISCLARPAYWGCRVRWWRGSARSVTAALNGSPGVRSRGGDIPLRGDQVHRLVGVR